MVQSLAPPKQVLSRLAGDYGAVDDLTCHGILPNDEAIVRLVGVLRLETNNEWAVARRYMSLETLARVTDNSNVWLPAVAA